MARRLPVEAYVAGVRSGDRAVLGRAITLVESTRADDRALAREVLEALAPDAGGAHRVGVSGVPGVGKSTFLEALGTRLLDAGRRVAVLAVDPSSARSGGSILGDKTRMARLAADRRAFIRPSPTSGSLGGVHRKTRETMLLVEAAGFDVVFVETVGVGQSEIDVADMVDTFLLLLLTGAGDELQGIKRGILEVADVLAVTKADGDNLTRAARTRREAAAALHFLTPADAPWQPPVLTCSAVTGEGLDGVWEAVSAHRRSLDASGRLGSRRREQAVRWMWAAAREEVLRRFREDPGVAARVAPLEEAVAAGRMPPSVAAERLVEAFEADVAPSAGEVSGSAPGPTSRR